MSSHYSNFENLFFEHNLNNLQTTRMPYFVVNNFMQLGFATSIRFLEWVIENPNGVISLPTGKTPEYFIKWTKYILENWNSNKVKDIRAKYLSKVSVKPDLSQLHFVQIDEFYPISSKQHNSFNYYVKEFYIKGLGLDESKALLINSDEIPLYQGKHFSEVFPDYFVDLSLRNKNCKSETEYIQQQSIFLIDQWCTEYEQKIKALGGIGFFLGGIGPDGHIAFNVRGTDHNSTTRLTNTNFETQAVAAGDLGGMEVSRNRLVITIGLKTITLNPDATAIIIAAGESKAEVVRDALQNKPANLFPATVLQTLKNSRFYITKGASVLLNENIEKYYKKGDWTHEKTERVIIDLCKSLNKFGKNLTLDDLKQDEVAKHIPNLNSETVISVVNSIKEKIEKGLSQISNQKYLHTGPHHDDIMLGLLPEISHELSGNSNEFNFAVCTSGFTAVSNAFIIKILKQTEKLISIGRIEMIYFPDFFESGYKLKWDKDVYYYLNKVASGEEHERIRAISHRVVRVLTEIYKLNSEKELLNKIHDLIYVLNNSYEGEKNTTDIQILKGKIREYEEELVWAHYGVQVKNVHHLRLGFYKGDIFTEQPQKQRDVLPVLKMFKKYNPTIISVVIDPEGSGPDTHYKVLQTIAEALRLWQKEKDLSELKIMGYRNVWYHFHPSEADVIFPVSLNSMTIFNESFRNCYLSQVNASFPSYKHDGKFSELAQKIWINQYNSIKLLLGKTYFYQSDNPVLRATHGLIYYKEMDINSFLSLASKLESQIEGGV